MKRSWLRAAVLAPGCAALGLSVTACGVSTNGTATPAAGSASVTSPSPSPSPSPAGAVPAGGFPTTAAGLSAFLVRGTRSITTAHVAMSIDAGVQSITSQGDEVFAAGHAVAYRLLETVPNLGRLDLVMVRGTTYVRLPRAYRTSGRPWSLVTPRSTNAVVRAMASSTSSLGSMGAAGLSASFLRAARDVRLLGTTRLAGVPVAHYSLAAVLTELPFSPAQRAALQQLGVGSVPVELFVDRRGRTRRVTESFTAGSLSVRTQFVCSDIGEALHITAPPASQVSATG